MFYVSDSYQYQLLFHVPISITCYQYQSLFWSYVGETGRSFGTRKKEHIRNVKNHKKGSSIAKHAWDMDHIIDFENGKVIDIGNYRTRKTLES